MNQKGFNMSMLEYCKLILEKISFSRTLFRKEYRKTFRYLDAREHFELKTWLRAKMKRNREQQYTLDVDNGSKYFFSADFSDN